MHKSVTDAGNGNISSLGIVHAEGAICTMLVGLVLKFLLQCSEIVFQMEAKMLQFCGTLFSLYKAREAMPESG